jgi:hypothetical protein
MVRLQYLLGLRALGHEPYLLELVEKSGDPALDAIRVDALLARCREYGLAESCIILLHSGAREDVTLDSVEVVGRTEADMREVVSTCDLLWNDCDALAPSLLQSFRRRVLLDLDPGHLQVSGLDVDLGLEHHDAFLTVGLNMDAKSCASPTLGRRWHPFAPFVHLPLWNVNFDRDRDSPFTSVTHWSWGELRFGEQVLSISKRDGYLRYLDLPSRAGRPFELAVALGDPRVGDRQLLEANGWRVTDPWLVAGSPASYQDYIQRSRAEICCPKPVFAELRTGWFSDRSACYLASGRPVLARDTGFRDHLPVGSGLLSFESTDEAVQGVTEIDAQYEHHARAARAIAEDVLDARIWLPRMIDSSFEGAAP